MLNLPTNYRRVGTPSDCPSTHIFRVENSFVQQIKIFIEHEDITLQTLFLATYLSLLYRYTSQEEITIGVVTEREQLIALQVVLSPESTGCALLSQVEGNMQMALSKQGDSFASLRDEFSSAAFQAIFVNCAPPAVVWGQTNLNPGVDLAFMLAPQPIGNEDLVASVVYNAERFDASIIARLVGHFQTLLAGIVADPAQAIVRLPLLTAAETQQILVEWNQTATPYPQQSCIHHLLEQPLAQTPDAVAVSFGAQQLTYRELHARANQLAHQLAKLGVGPDCLVGIYVERSVEMVIGLLGILKAGGAYVPLDPHFPAERLTFMLEDANATVLLTTAQLLNPLEKIVPAGQKCHVVCLDTIAAQPHDAQTNLTVTDWTEIAKEPNTPPITKVQPDQLAYCIYTSGSTGKPKGVEIEHRTVVNFLTSMRHKPGLTANDILLAVTTISFDIAGLELYLPLMVGAKVVLTTRTIAASGQLLAQLMQDVGATVMQATPATWHLLLAAGWPGQPGLKILCGGEALSQALANQLLTKGVALWNLYGPTETTIWSTAYLVEPGRREPGRDTPEPIGRPIANTQIYILNAAGQPMPIGVPGDLYIGGAGLARGYRNRPTLTMERFIPNPFGEGRIYKTGDLARYAPDGQIEFLGRSDHQVKIRGFRIELGEIEAALMRHPLVREVVVVARQDEADGEDKRLVAYVVLTPQPTDQKQVTLQVESAFRVYLAAQLPDYMIPAYFVVLPAMPLTPNGKINRLALPAPTAHRPNLATPLVMPQTKIEQLIARTWQEVLRLATVGIHDNFFELGGNSLLLTQAYTKLLQEESMNGHSLSDLSTTALLEYPTIYSLAHFISQRTHAAQDGRKAIPFARGNEESVEKQSDRRSRRTELAERRVQRARR